jgi:vesicular inhibitory amino acid transporter
MQATFSITNVLVGAGMLTLPYGYRLAGWSAAALLVVATATMGFSALLLGKSFDAVTEQLMKAGIPESSRDFSTLGFMAFGKAGRNVIGVLVAVEMWTTVVSLVVLLGINGSLLTGLPVSTIILASGLLGFAMPYMSMQELAHLSVVNMLAIVATVLALFVSGFTLQFSGEVLPEFNDYHSLVRPEGLTPSLGMCIFAFAGHPCLPAIYWSMQDRREFSGACCGGFALAVLFYLLVGASGYYFFGDFVEQSFTSNLGSDLAGKALSWCGALGMFAAACFTLKLQGTLPLYFGSTIAALRSTAGLSKDSKVILASLRIGVVLMTVYAALVFQSALSDVTAAAGGLLVITTSLVFPCVAYWRVSPDLGIAMRTLLVAVTCAGIAFAVYSTASALSKALVKNDS